jgi:hypothetical protein
MSSPLTPDCDDYQGWLADLRTRAGDGEYDDAEPPRLPQRDMAFIERAFRSPDELSIGERVEWAREQLRAARRPPDMTRRSETVDVELPNEEGE